MSDEPLTNAAVESYQAQLKVGNEFTEPPPPSEWPIAEEFWFEDRRPGSPFFGYGRMDRTEAIKGTSELWSLGNRSPRRTIVEVVAVRGDACAAVIERIDVGDVVMEHINCFTLDPASVLLGRIVRFDLDDRDDAIALLDEWHAEIGD